MLDEKRHVLHGAATRLGGKQPAPAHSIGADADRFDIGWLCPFCGRNTLRTFYAGALKTVEAGAAAVEPAAAVADAKPPV